MSEIFGPNAYQNYLGRTERIESGGKHHAVSSTGAAGPFQFTLGTAKHYGLSPADRFDFIKSSSAALQLAIDNARYLTGQLGRQPTTAEVYFAHQQGPAGAAALLSHPTMPAWQALATAGISPANARRNIAVNGGDPDAPASAFAAKWTGKFDGSTPIAAPQGGTPQVATTEAPAMPPPIPEDTPYPGLPGEDNSMADAGLGDQGELTDAIEGLRQQQAFEDQPFHDATAGGSDKILQRVAQSKTKPDASPLADLFQDENIKLQKIGTAGRVPTLRAFESKRWGA